MTAVVHAGFWSPGAPAAQGLPPGRADTPGPAEEPEDRAEDVADALSLLQAAREDLDSLEAALLLAARQPGRHGGKPLLTFRQIAAAIGAESEQAAQCRYRCKVGNLNNNDSGNDGTPLISSQNWEASNGRCAQPPLAAKTDSRFSRR